MRNFMIAGTASNVGKNTVACALLRLCSTRAVMIAPYKPLSIDHQSSAHTVTGLTTSIAIQCLAAKCDEEDHMNPIRLVYHGQPGPSLLINGAKSTLEILSSQSEVKRILSTSIESLTSRGFTIGAEIAGALSEWDTDPMFQTVVKLLDPAILLVADCHNGGALASLLGTLELIDKSNLKRCIGVILNRFDGGAHATYVRSIHQSLKSRFGVGVVGVMPTVHNANRICEDLDYFGSKAELEETITILARLADSWNLPDELFGVN